MKVERIKVNFKKLDPRAYAPAYGTEFAAGADLYSIDADTAVKPRETVFIHTGLALEIPEGLVGLIYARSGLACKQGLAPANKVGVIDSDYRGEIMIALHNHSSNEVIVSHGERVAQIVFTHYFAADFTEVEELEDTVRGEGGFGSTDKN